MFMTDVIMIMIILLLLGFVVSFIQMRLMGKQLRQILQLQKRMLGENQGKMTTMQEVKLYVGNVDYATTESELEYLFSRYGQVVQVNIPVDKHTGRARGFGFVTLQSEKGGDKAIELNGTEFKGRQIQVNFAKERL